MLTFATVASYFVFASTPFVPVGNRRLAYAGTTQPSLRVCELVASGKYSIETGNRQMSVTPSTPPPARISAAP